MRILCLSNMYPGPGDPDYGAFVEEMAGALEARGHEVEPVVIDTRARGPVRTPAKYAGLLGRAMTAARRADVIYAHYLFPTGTVAAACGRAARRPWVVTAHGQDVANLSRGTVRRATGRALAGCAGVIAVSEYLAAGLRDAGLDLPPVHVAHMGVDTAAFRPGDRAAARRALGLPPDGPLVLAVGGLTHRKDPLTLLQAVAILRGARPDARVAYVGDGPLAAALAAGIRRTGMEGAVIRAGAVPHAEVAAWMAACDVLAMVSRIEPLGIAGLEALASGRPVVTTAVGGAREVIPATGPGRVVAPGDPHAIASALADVLAAPPPPAACRAAAEPHSVARQAEIVEGVLRAAAGDRTEGATGGDGRVPGP